MSPVNSMTGFGRAEKSSDLGTFSVEAKSVNHRYGEVKVYLPRELSALEIPLARITKGRLARGKADIAVRWTPSPLYTPRATFNMPLLEQYEVEIASIAGRLQRQEKIPLDSLLNLPGVIDKTSPPIDESALLAQAGATLGEALDALVAQRRCEGEALAAEIASRLDKIEETRSSIVARSDDVIQSYRVKLSKKTQEWAQTAGAQLDPGRLEAEVLMFAERSDITEELVRLEAHLTAFRRALMRDDGEPQGRAMEFLTQELLREANTIAGKSRDTAIASAVLAMKNEIEKVREQVLNIE